MHLDHLAVREAVDYTGLSRLRAKIANSYVGGLAHARMGRCRHAYWELLRSSRIGALVIVHRGNPLVTAPALHAIAPEFVDRRTPVRFLLFLSLAPVKIKAIQ